MAALTQEDAIVVMVNWLRKVAEGETYADTLSEAEVEAKWTLGFQADKIAERFNAQKPRKG